MDGDHRVPAARRVVALMVFVLLVAPTPAALAASNPASGVGSAVPGEITIAPPGSTPASDAEDSTIGPRVRGGLLEEPQGATASIIIRLRTEPLSQVLLELRAVYGPQDGWSKAALEDAAARLSIRDAALGLERRALNDTLAQAGVDATYARDYRYLANAVNLRDVPTSAIPFIVADPRVLHVQRDTLVQAMLSASVPLIGAPSVWNRTDTLGRNMTGTGSLIANIDTGVDYSHPSLGGTLNRTADFARVLAGNHSTFAGGWDFVNSDNDPWDDHFHGTHVAGIIGANGTLVGVAPGSRQLALKVLSASGYGSSSDVIAAMEFATDPDRNPLTDDAADASSMSLGGWSAWADDVEALAADASTLLGTLCVIAAGNSGSQLNTVGSPGISRESITVGSTTKADAMSGFSSRGPTLGLDIKPDVVAPGSGINSTLYGGTGGFTPASGTSMATPHISGVVALIKQAHPTWTVDQVRSALVNTGVDIGRGVYEQGGGRVDSLAAVLTELTANPHKLPIGRLSSLAGSTNVSLAFTNVGKANLSVNFSAFNVHGLTPALAFVNNNTNLNSVTVSPSSATLAPGQTTTVVVTVVPLFNAPAGHYWGYVMANASASVIRVPLAYVVRAPVLLVDDDMSDRGMSSAVFDNYAGFPSSSNNLSAALDRAGVAHDIITTVHYAASGPDALELKNYGLVIWNTGYDYDYNDSDHLHHTLSTRDQAALSAYLDVGGQLWLIGESIAWDLYHHQNTSVPAADFLNAYLGVGYVEHDLNTPNPTNGSASTFMQSAIYPTSPDWISESNNGDFATNLTPTSRGVTILEGNTTDIFNKSYPAASLAVAVNNSTYRSVYWGFEYSWLSTNAAFDDALSRTLGFFDMSQSPALPLGDLAVEVATDPMPWDWLPILETAWGRPFDSMAEVGQPFNVSVSVLNLGSTAQTNVEVLVRILDNASVTQQQATVTIASVPALARVSSSISFTAEKHGYFSVRAQLVFGDGNPTNDVNTSTVLVPNWQDDLTSTAAGWTLGGSWATYTSGYWTAPASIGAGALSVAANQSAVSPLLNFSKVNASATAGAARLYLRISGLINSGDALHVETRNVSSSQWTVERTLTPFAAQTFWNYFLLGAPLSTLAGTQGQFRLRLETAANSSSYFFADHFMAWTFHEFGTPMAPAILVVNATRAEAQALDFRALHNPWADDTNSANYTYAWNFGDGSSSSARNTSHAYADNGSFLARLTVDHSSGVRDVAFFTVAVANVAPAIGSAGASAEPSDEGSSVTFLGVCTDPSPQDTVSYSWNFGDGTSNATGATVAHTYPNDGVFSVQLTCADEDGGVSVASFNHTVQNIAPAVVSTGSTPNPSDEGQLVNFTADCSDVGAFDNITFEWDFGDGSATATGANASHTYEDDGNYSVTLTCTDTGGGNSSVSFSHTVLNVDPVIGSANSSPNPSDEGQDVQFQATCQDDGALDTLSMEWDFGDTTPVATGSTVNHTYADDSSYDVTVTCTDDDGGADTATFTHDVLNVAPTGSIVSVNTSLEGESVSFTAIAFDPGTQDQLQLAFNWDFGDGTTSTLQNPSHIFRDNGVFTVTLTVSDNAPSSSIVATTITVSNVAPTVVPSANGTRVEGTTLDFSAVVTDPGVLDTFSYLWQFGDSQISSQSSPSHAYLDDGTYDVNLTVTDKDGASTSRNFTIVVSNLAPRADLSVLGAAPVEGVPVTFMINATDAGVLDVLNVTVDYGDGSGLDFPPPGVGGTVAHPYPDEGTYTVQLTVRDDDGDLVTVEVVINVTNAAPLLLAEPSAYVVGEGSRVNLTASATDLGLSDTVALSWDLGALGGNVTGAFASVVLEQDGTYQFTARAADNDGAVSTVTLEVVVQNVAPTMVVTLETTTQEAVEGRYIATVTDPGVLDVVGVFWVWGDGETSVGLDVNHAYADAGQYTIAVRAFDEAGGEDLQTFTITVGNSAPLISRIDVFEGAREGELVAFNATVINLPGEALTYSWEFGDSGTSQNVSPTHVYRDDGQYTVFLTVTDGEGGTSTLSILLDVENVAPQVQCDVCPTTSVQGKTVSVRVSALDPGLDEDFSFSLRTPDGNTLTSVDGIFDFAIEEAGTASVVITANDGDATSPAFTLTLNVQLDTDRDGLADATDTDDDNDGVADTEDPAPLDPLIGPPSSATGIPLVWILVLVLAAGAGLALFGVWRRRGDDGDSGK